MHPDGLAAVVLAGSHHWSGSSFESLCPRPLVPVALSPLLSYSLRWLREGGIRQAVICANGTTRFIEAVFGGGADLDMEIRYYRDGTPRGAAGCVRDAGLLTGADTLVVVDGTAIPTVDLAELIAAHQASGAAATAVVHRASPLAPPTPGGVYLFERRVLDHVLPAGFQDIKESLIPKLHRAGEPVVAHPSDTFCPHVINAQTYLEVNHWMLRRLCRAQGSPDGLLLQPGASIEPGARLVGPVQLGTGARILAGATVVGPTTIGPYSTVGRNAMVARSVVWSRCVVGEGSVVHACVLGHGAVVPAGSRLFNVVRSQPRMATLARDLPLRRPVIPAPLASAEASMPRPAPIPSVAPAVSLPLSGPPA
jgi:NDP-sugar pyrophosphorylase family protein